MNHSFKILPEENLIINTLVDTFNFAEYQILMEKILSDEKFIPSMNMIWDYRESTLAGFSFQDTLKRKEYVNKNQERRGYNYRVAFLVDKAIDYGICRMYQIISEDLPATFEVFYDAQEAFNWLRKINHSQPRMVSIDAGHQSFT